MKLIFKTQFVNVPEGVTAKTKARMVTIKGSRGTLERSFKHLTVDIQVVDNGRKIRVDCWFGTRKQIACVRTCCTHIDNMITGVSKGYMYKMRPVSAHFPIHVTLSGKDIEVRNYLGEKRIRSVPLLDGVSFAKSTDVKDQIELTGNDVNAVSLQAARVHHSTAVKGKDIRKFLDGIYVSQRMVMKKE